jgi:serine O-acetyltransferase
MSKFKLDSKRNHKMINKLYLAVYRIGSYAFYQVKIPIFRQVSLFLAKSLNFLIIYIIGSGEIAVRCRIGGGLRIPHGFNGIVIHPDAIIGENVTMFHQVTIGADDPNPTGAPKIGNNVFIGTGAKIIGSITIGDNAKIGANAVVVKDVPAGATAVGVPAKVIKSSVSAAI